MGTLSKAFAADSSIHPRSQKNPASCPAGEGGMVEEHFYMQRDLNFKKTMLRPTRACGLKRGHSKRNRYLVFQRRMDDAKMNECVILYPYIRMPDQCS